MNLLAIQIKKLGDLILSAPALQSLRSHSPHARITLIVDASAAQLRPLFSSVDEVLIYEKGKPNLSLWRHLATSSFDACLDFSGTDRSALMTRLSRAKKRITSEKLGAKPGKKRTYNTLVPASVRNLHTVDYHQQFLSPLGIESPPPLPELAIPAETATQIDALLADNDLLGQPYAILHPGTAWAEKYWSTDSWASVIDHLAQTHDLPCILTGGPAPDEQAHLAEIIDKAQSPVLNLSTHTTLLHLTELIRRATLMISVDTLAMHLGDAFQKPQIVLFGPTNPFHWRPRHPGATILLAGQDTPLSDFTPRHEASPMSRLPPDPVRAAIDKLAPGLHTPSL
jgi:ADP-heptose:LPS heptosyltransferase